MSVPWYAPGDPSYCQVKAIAGNTVVYHQLSFVEYVEPESRKWHVRADRFAITCLGVSLIDIWNPHFPSALHYTLLVLQFLMLCLQLYCTAKTLLAFGHECRASKGPSYHIFAGPAYTDPLSPNCDLGSDNSVEAHISGQTEKVSFSE
ncbi:hypothetical protein E8E15_005120 [Penicillium rubens]|uniref:Uncharacterized protein n=1 Tax=Penicillium chrysogenum TaxID=5076 RepID=A0A167U2M1_PENCH|nr:hypothetical protein E8E15_005120 [Penicillium rubens]KZN88857.1 hypothetical protein EN45_074470 [Penicillium chrysogenum]